MKQKIKLAIVDDHQIVIDGLLSLLEGHDRFHVLITTTDPRKLLDLLAANPVDILLTDVMMPHLNGDELVKHVRAKYPSIKILALSMSGQGDTVNKMIDDANPLEGEAVRTAGVNHQRDITRSFYNLIWKSLLSGINATIGNKRQMKRP